MRTATKSMPGLSKRCQLAPTSTIRELLAVTEQPGMVSLAGGLPDPASFPVDALRAASARVLTGAVAARALQYGPTDGLAEFRDAIARTEWLHGLEVADPAAIVVTTGSQQALDLLTRVLIDPGDDVAVDDPCYLGARQTLMAGGARLRGFAVDQDGLVVDALADALLAGYRPRVLYTVANFQNPTGGTLTPQRRVQLAGLAERYGFFIIDDDPYRSLSFGATAPTPLGALQPELAVSVGSLSKVLSPGMRLGWMHAPRHVREAVVRMKQACDLHTATLTQLIAGDVLDQAAFLGAHVEQNRQRYASRAQTLVTALRERGVACTAPQGGMFVWVRFDGVDTDELLAATVARNVAFVPGSAFAVDASWSEYARLSFATASADELRHAARVIADAARSMGWSV